jgi:hypothetical protein
MYPDCALVVMVDVVHTSHTIQSNNVPEISAVAVNSSIMDTVIPEWDPKINLPTSSECHLG